MDFIVRYIPFIVQGFLKTLQVTYFGLIVGLFLGILLAVGDLYGGKIVSTIVRFYVEFFRGSPIIAQLFIFYFSIPQLLNTRIDSTIIGLMVFALNSAAYQKGYIKGAMESVYKDQMTAALSLGLSKVQAITYIVLPQALRIMIPGWSNEFTSLAKSTATLLVIGERDLTAIGRTIASRSFRVIETYAFTGLIYLIWISIMIKILDIIHDKIKIPGIGITA